MHIVQLYICTLVVVQPFARTTTAELRLAVHAQHNIGTYLSTTCHGSAHTYISHPRKIAANKTFGHKQSGIISGHLSLHPGHYSVHAGYCCHSAYIQDYTGLSWLTVEDARGNIPAVGTLIYNNLKRPKVGPSSNIH